MTTTEPSARYGRATKLGFDPTGGAWVAICERHHLVINIASRDQARALITNTATFCELCREDVEQQDVEYTPDFDLEVVEAMPTPPTEPILGTYYNAAGTEAHHAIALSEAGATAYMRTICKPDKAMLVGTETSADNPAMCTYCLAGIEAPSQTVKQAKAAKVKTVKPAKVKEPTLKVTEVAEEPEQEPVHAKLTLDVFDDVHTLLDALEQSHSVPDAKRALDILEPALMQLRTLVPRRRRSQATGARSGFNTQASTFQPGPHYEQVRQFAEQGDRRAIEIVKHAEAYVPGENCRYCLDHYGKEARHQAALAFCSIGRELKAMQLRAMSTSEN